VIDDSAYGSPTETAVGTDEPATGIHRLPPTPSLPIEALSSFQTTLFQVLWNALLPQALYERQTSLWRKAGLIFTAPVRVLFASLSILLHRHQAYYWISPAELHNRYMDEVIVPWVEETAHVVRQQTVARRMATTSAENVEIESHRGQVECLLALRCNVSAVLAVLL